jgi:hypothetical protein
VVHLDRESREAGIQQTLISGSMTGYAMRLQQHGPGDLMQLAGQSIAPEDVIVARPGSDVTLNDFVIVESPYDNEYLAREM